MNIPAKLAKNIAKTANRNIFIILFMHSETIFFDYLCFFWRMQCANNDTLHSDILLFNDYFFYFRERTVYCFAVYFSVSAYFVITGPCLWQVSLLSYQFLLWFLYVCIYHFGKHWRIPDIHQRLLPCSIPERSFGCGSHRQRRSREDCFTLYCY